MTAQRFPDDYDGIVSGAPVFRFTSLHMGQLWTSHATLKKPGAVLTREDFTRVGEAAVAQCDAKDGVKDGIIADPRTCDFDPGKLQGFKPEQIEALKLIYQGAVNPRTGVQIYPGLEPGGEGPQPGNPGWAHDHERDDAVRDRQCGLGRHGLRQSELGLEDVRLRRRRRARRREAVRRAERRRIPTCAISRRAAAS